MNVVKAALIFGLLVILSACGGGSMNEQEITEESEEVIFERNTEFRGPWIRVFVETDDGRELSVNSNDNAVETNVYPNVVPNHQTRRWRLEKVDADGSSYIIAVVSWDPNDTDDYLIAGWWAHFNEEEPPNLTYQNLSEFAIIDGPEFDPLIVPELELPTSGTASYNGPAGGTYLYVPGSTLDQGLFVEDGWEATVNLTTNFKSRTIEGCIGCSGDLTKIDALIPSGRGNVSVDISDYELHLKTTRYDDFGTSETGIIEVHHPDRNSVSVATDGAGWQAILSNRPDMDENPRLIGGFVSTLFEEQDNSLGSFFGTYVALSEAFENTRKPSP
ncbi:MAG: hypothetical protein OXF60_00430 [Gammaproteobacteria bacterium]|nr:hypothetical protein [Gammaproteobacteria bacterium]